MGSPVGEEGRSSDEVLHEVTLTQPFFLGKYEVTRAQWKAVMGYDPLSYKDDCDDCPVGHVSWDEIQEFIDGLNVLVEEGIYRLPTEAEWEYAARAGTQTAYHFGDDPGDLGNYAWYDGNNDGGTHPVGRKLPNGCGTV